MSHWEEITDDFGPDDHNGPSSAFADSHDSDDTDAGTPFGGIDQVDGLVYSNDVMSPELQWAQHQTPAPTLPVRERPQPPAPQRVDPWKPGPDPVPATAREIPPLFRMLAVLIVPMVFLGGLGLIVFRVMQAYGL